MLLVTVRKHNYDLKPVEISTGGPSEGSVGPPQEAFLPVCIIIMAGCGEGHTWQAESLLLDTSVLVEQREMLWEL